MICPRLLGSELSNLFAKLNKNVLRPLLRHSDHPSLFIDHIDFELFPFSLQALITPYRPPKFEAGRTLNVRAGETNEDGNETARAKAEELGHNNVNNTLEYITASSFESQLRTRKLRQKRHGKKGCHIIGQAGFRGPTN